MNFVKIRTPSALFDRLQRATGCVKVLLRAGCRCGSMKQFIYDELLELMIESCEQYYKCYALSGIPAFVTLQYCFNRSLKKIRVPIET